VYDPEIQLAKLTEAALRRYSMIEEGDRILIAVSGGKDSTSMAFDLASKRRWWPATYEIRAIHVATDLESSLDRAAYFDLLSSWGIETVSNSVPVIQRIKEGHSMNCFWCSMQRRTELLAYAMKEGFSKIALGHHLDDIVETLFMNMLYKRQISTMLPFFKYDKYPVSVIRPLALCEERQIVAFAKAKGFQSVTCTCAYGCESKRREVRGKIAELTGGSSKLKRNLFDSMSNVREQYLPKPGLRPTQRGERDSQAGADR
jgi:tRNA 2-thiocytidine biosynthesis protein TtcA